MSERVTSQATPNSIFKISSQQKGIFLIAGIGALAVGLFIAPAAMGIGVMMLSMYFVNGGLEVVRFYDRYSEVKVAIARSRWMIMNSDIEDVEVTDIWLTLTVKDGEKDEPVKRKIPIKAFNEQDRAAIIHNYQQIYAGNK